MTSIFQFKVNRDHLKILTPNEKKLLSILQDAVKKVDKIFLLQENYQYPGSNLYPHGISKKEIEYSAEQDSRIFSPFTIVEKDRSGKLIAVDYHIKYSKYLVPIVKLLNHASEIAENKSFKKYLAVLAKSLMDGTYQQADIAWLAVKDSNIDLSVGPHERHLDKLFFIKRAYQGHVGIIDEAQSSKARLIRDILYTTISPKPHMIVPPSVVSVQVQHNLLFSGFLGRILFSLQTRPSDADTTERYGSKILGYLSSIDLKFEKLIYPIFNVIFEKKFKERYTKEILRRGNYYNVLLYGIAQQLHRYKNSRERLKELFPVFDEAGSEVSGVQHAKHLILKGVIDQKELEAIMIAYICWMFSEWIISKKSAIRSDYLRGDALNLNFLIREGALLEKDGFSWPNFAKMFFEIENLSSIFVHFLEEGNYWEAQEFLSKYLSFEPFEVFDRRLSNIKPL